MSANPTPKPGALVWYRVYAVLMTVLYVSLVLILGALLLFSKKWLPHADPDLPPWLGLGYLAFLAFTSLSLAALFLVSFFLPRSPGAWTYHIILICLGMSSPCFIPISVPLLIFWLQDPVKDYFGKN